MSSAPPRSSSHRARSTTSRPSPASARRWPRERPQRRDPADRVREELRAPGRQQVHLPRPSARPQDAGAPGGRGGLRRARPRRAHDDRQAQAQAARLHIGQDTRVEEGGRAAAPGRPHRIVRRPGDRRVMAVKRHKPTSPGRRFATWFDHAELTKKEPERNLVEGITKSGGRNTHGRITSRHRGGGAKRRYRRIDFRRTKDGVPAKVATIEYDPNRTTYIALLHYADGDKRYILAPQGLRPGARVESGERADIRPGNALPLRNIPTGTVVHNVELVPGQGGRLGRAAGSGIQVVAKEGPMVTLRLPSSEMRLVRADCRATVGALSNSEHQNVELGKAGRARHKGVRPQTRGVAMNPVDHPHGGGEAHHTPGGHPETPWGKPTLGYRTRKKGKSSDGLIVRGRRRGKRKGGKS